MGSECGWMPVAELGAHTITARSFAPLRMTYLPRASNSSLCPTRPSAPCSPAASTTPACSRRPGSTWPRASAKYADYRTGPDAWALGRFVVPAARLAELERRPRRRAAHRSADRWRLSVLARRPTPPGAQALGEFNCRHAADGRRRARPTSSRPGPTAVGGRRAPAGCRPALGPGLRRDPARPRPRAARRGRSRRRGGRAKVRTGGVTAGRVPAGRRLSPASSAPAPTPACPSRRPPGCIIRSAPSTGSPMSPTAPAAPCSASSTCSSRPRSCSPGMGDADVGAPAGGARPDGDPLRCRRRRVAGTPDGPRDALAPAPASPASSSFGSCSFTEPIADLQSLDLL